MSNAIPSTTTLESKGPLSGIECDVTRKEIGKLWNRIEAHTGTPSSPLTSTVVFTSNADLTAVQTNLQAQIDALSNGSTKQAGSAVVGSGGGSVASSVSNIFTGLAAPAVPTLAAYSLSAGTISVAGSVVPILPGTYTAALDVSLSTLTTATAGPVAALLVQHRATSGVATGGGPKYAVYAAIETTQQGSGADAGYFFASNLNGFNTAVSAVHGVTYYSGASSLSLGITSDNTRRNSDGFMAAFVARCYGDTVNGLCNPDAAYTVASVGTQPRTFGSLFQGGSVGLGAVLCNYGLDLAAASCNLSAIVIPATKLITLNGYSGSATIGATAAGQVQIKGGSGMWAIDGSYGVYVSNGNIIWGIQSNGLPLFGGPGSNAASAGSAAGRFLNIRILGVGDYKIALLNP